MWNKLSCQANIIILQVNNACNRQIQILTLVFTIIIYNIRYAYLNSKNVTHAVKHTNPSSCYSNLNFYHYTPPI